jgi:hypothetical protein
VDGKECARLEVAGSASRQIEINEGAELLEIWTEHKSEPLLLATHKIAYSGTQGIAPANLSFRFNTAELILQIASNDTAQESARRSSVTLTCRSHAQSAGAFPKWLIAAPKFALASIALIALGWFLGLNAHHRTRTKQIAFPGFAEGEKPSLQPLPAPTPSEIAQNSEQPATYRLVPDELATRGNGASDIPSVMVPSHPALVQLELPIASQNMFKDAAKYAPKSFHCSLKTFLKDEIVLSENGLKARRSSSGAIVTFSLLSTFLAENTDYSVDLRSDFHGKSEQLSTYTFHVVKQSK